MNKLLLVLSGLILWLLLAATVPPVYLFTVGTGRLVLLVFAGRFTVMLLAGQSRGVLAFLAGVGGLLYVAGLTAEVFGLAGPNAGINISLLFKVLGFAFLVLPFALGSLPHNVRRSLGMAEAL